MDGGSLPYPSYTKVEFRWNHATKPSTCEVRGDGKLLFSGTYTAAMKIYEALPRQNSQNYYDPNETAVR